MTDWSWLSSSTWRIEIIKITPSTQNTDDGLPGSSRLSLLITKVIEQEVGPLVLPDD